MSAEARIADLIRALKASGSSDALDLATRLARCQQGRADRRAGHAVGWRPMCRSPACECCRRWLATRAAATTRRRFARAANAECWHVTILLARCGSLDAARDLVRSTRRGLRNLRDRLARADRRWAGVELAGMAELDALGPDDMPLLPPQRREVMQQLPAFGGGPDHAAYGYQVAWVPHLHLAVHAPALNRADLADAFAEQWPGLVRRVDVSPFWPGTAADNAERILGYGSKHRMEIKLDRGSNAGCVVVPWPAAVQAAYWSWLHRQKNGLQMWRVMLGAGRDTVS